MAHAGANLQDQPRMPLEEEEEDLGLESFFDVEEFGEEFEGAKRV